MSIVSPVEIVPVGPATVAARLFRVDGRLHLTAIAKIRMRFTPDAAMRPTDPTAIVIRDVVDDDTGEGVVASEVVPYRPGTDVLFRGRAHVAGGKPQTPVRLVVAQPVALGGPLEEAAVLVDKTLCAFEVAGFGPVPSRARERSGLLTAEERGRVERGLPELWNGMDFTYFHAAPRDQRAPHLRGDEWIFLERLHPSMPRFSTCLPRLTPTAVVRAPKGKRVPVAMKIDTLAIDGDEQTCEVVARGAFAIGSETDLQWISLEVGYDLAHILDEETATEPGTRAPRRDATMLIEPPHAKQESPGRHDRTLVLETAAAPAASAPRRREATMLMEPAAAAPPPRARAATVILEPAFDDDPSSDMTLPPRDVSASLPGFMQNPHDGLPFTVMPSVLDENTVSVVEPPPSVRAPFKVARPTDRPSAAGDIPGAPWAKGGSTAPPALDFQMSTLDAETMDISDGDLRLAMAEPIIETKEPEKKLAPETKKPKSSPKEPWRNFPEDRAAPQDAPKAPRPKIGGAPAAMRQSLYGRFKKS